MDAIAPKTVTTCCPCCGGPIEARDPAPFVRSAFTGESKESRLAQILLERFGSWTETSSLIDILYGADHADRHNARKCINIFAFNARRRLEPFGLTIKGRVGGTGGYRLEWVAP